MTVAGDLDPWGHAARAFAASAVRDRWLYDPVAWAHDVIDWRDGGLTAYQEDALGLLAKHRRVAVRGPHGLGKALRLDTPVPTPGGWSTVGQLRPGDSVFDEQGKPCRVVGKSPVWRDDTYEVEFADGTVVTTHANHEWQAIDVYNRPRTPRPERRRVEVADWRDHWAFTKRVTTADMAQRLRTRGGQLRWRVPTARPLELPTADLPVDPYLFGYWLGDGHTAGARFTVQRSDWPNLQKRIRAAGYHHGEPRGYKHSPDVLSVTISTQPVRLGGTPGRDSLSTRLRALGVLGDKRIPLAYLRASVEQRRDLVRGLWDSDGYRQAGGCDEITLTCKPLVDGVADLLRSLGLVVRVRESASKLDGRVVGRRWRIAARFDFNPYRLPRYDWTPPGRQASRHTQRTVVDVRKVEDQPTQCIEVDSPSHLFLAGEAMVPTHNSTSAATTVLWFATTREAAGLDWKIITTASAWRALTTYLWPEIHKWSRRIRWDVLGRSPFSDLTELLTLNLKLVHGAASAVASNRAELIEGAHADSLLYVIDEAKVVPDATWDAIEGAFSGGRTSGFPEAFALAISTPGPPVGRFYDIHARKPGLEDWHTRHVTLEEAIAAGRISRDWAEARARQWGADSALYANRVLGEFHASDEDSVIPLAWVEAAVERWHEWDQAGRPPLAGRRFLGVDVARTGGDYTVLAHRHGSAVTGLETHDKEDTMRTVARVQAAAGADGKVTPVVDSIGVGGGVVDRLRELDVPVLAYTGAAKATGRTRDREWGFRNCLTGDARVLPIGGLRRIYRSWHEGPMFKVETASGDKFTATPNHQVLTRRGWVTVQSLRVGDQLLNAARRDTAHAGVRPEVQDMPPMLSEVYSAARRAFGAERVKGGTVDFHGDRPVGEVDVVTVNGQLLGVDPPGRQHPEQRYFGGLLHGFGPLLGGGLLPHALRVGARAGRVGAALPHALVAGSPNLALLERQPFLVKPVRLAAVTEGYAVIAQHGFDESVAHPGVLREGVPTFSASVAADDLLLVHPRLSVNAQRLTPPPDLHAMVPEDAANGVHVDTEGLRQWELCLSRLVPGDQRGLIHAGEGHGQAVSLPAPTWLDSAFAEDSVNGGPVRPELLRERVEGLAGGVPLDQVVNVERTTSGHGGTYVFTLETDTGSYRTRSVAHRNCRSQAYWRMRELLDPAYDSEVMLPPDDELLADLTAPTWDTTTGVPPKIRVETKEDLVKRMGRSPDKGDSVVMAFAGEWMKAGAVHSPARPGGGGTAARAASRYARPIGGGGGTGSGGRGR